MKIANDLVIYEVVVKQNLRAFLDISAFVECEMHIFEFLICRVGFLGLSIDDKAQIVASIKHW